jgi:hypothetical protein
MIKSVATADDPAPERHRVHDDPLQSRRKALQHFARLLPGLTAEQGAVVMELEERLFAQTITSPHDA